MFSAMYCMSSNSARFQDPSSSSGFKGCAAYFVSWGGGVDEITFVQRSDPLCATVESDERA